MVVDNEWTMVHLRCEAYDGGLHNTGKNKYMYHLIVAWGSCTTGAIMHCSQNVGARVLAIGMQILLLIFLVRHFDTELSLIRFGKIS